MNSRGELDEFVEFVNADEAAKVVSDVEPVGQGNFKAREERGREEGRGRRNGNSCGDTGDTGYIPSHIINPIPQSSIIALNTRTRLSGLRVL